MNPFTTLREVALSLVWAHRHPAPLAVISADGRTLEGWTR